MGDVLTGTAAALVSLLVAVRVLGLGDGSWRRPLDVTNDANLNAMIVKGVLDHGWGLQNPDLGAPFGQHLHDFPFADNLSLALVRIIGVFTPDWGLALNLFFVSTFALVAATSYVVARHFDVGHPAAAALAVLYSLAPYHFLRGEQHLFLSNYLAVPLGAGLALAALQGRGAVPRPGARIGGWWHRGTLLALLAAGAVASSVQYYPLFTIGLVAVAAVARAVAERTWRGAIGGGVVVVAIAGLFIVNVAPNLAYRVAHGANDEVAQRTVGETAMFSFQMVDLVLPMSGHRLASFRALQDRAADPFGQPPEFGSPALGSVATVGFFGLLALAVVGLAGRRSGHDTDRHLALLVVVALLLGWRGD